MKIEVVVAHYNGSAFIGEQLDSIQKNELPAGAELRILVLDDTSRPEEYEKLLATSSRWSNVRVERNARNMGVIRTFERGLELSQGDYVMLCDQDDIWLPHKIRVTLEKMTQIEDNSPALVFTNLTTVDGSLNVLTEKMLDRQGFDSAKERDALLFQNIVTGCTVMLNRALIRFALPFPKGIAMHDHWLAVCAAFAGKMGFVKEPTMLYRQHNANLVGQPDRSLRARLMQPQKTVRQFKKGLTQKSAQALSLSERLPDGPEKALTREVGAAFQNSSWTGLKFLVRAGVFQSEGLSFPLLCSLYLLNRPG